jgi:hypothetical protein
MHRMTYLLAFTRTTQKAVRYKSYCRVFFDLMPPK